MIRDLLTRVADTVVWYWPFTTRRTLDDICTEYDFVLDQQSQLIVAQNEWISDIVANNPSVKLPDWFAEEDVYTDDDHAIANMENDGVIDPNHYREP